MDLRSFTLGAMAGVTIFIGVFTVISLSLGLRWQPILIQASQ